MPTNFESQKVSARNLVLSINKQAAYGTALADANLTHRQKFDGSAVAELVQTRYSDKDMAGKGSEFASQGQVTAWDTKFGFKADLDDWLAGWLLAFGMGKEAVTGAGPYTHAISFDESTTQAASTTVYIEETADIQRKLLDMAVSDLTLTIPARGPISAEVNMIGTGHWANGAMVGGAPALASCNYLLGSDCTFSIGPNGAPVSKLGRHLSSTIKLSTGVANHTAPGLGLYGSFPRLGLRKVSFQTTIAAKDTDDVSTLLEGDTESELKWLTVSGGSTLTIDAPLVRLKTAKIGTQGNMVIWQIEGDETTMFNRGAGVLNATVINSVAAYLVGA